MIDDFEEAVQRYMRSERARLSGAPGGRRESWYWQGRADEYADQNSVDREKAKTEARKRVGK